MATTTMESVPNDSVKFSRKENKTNFEFSAFCRTYFARTGDYNHTKTNKPNNKNSRGREQSHSSSKVQLM